MRKEHDPRERALRARVAAFSLHARHDPRKTTANARATFASSFERLVDPDRKLPLAERLRRAGRRTRGRRRNPDAVFRSSGPSVSDSSSSRH